MTDDFWVVQTLREQRIRRIFAELQSTPYSIVFLSYFANGFLCHMGVKDIYTEASMYCEKYHISVLLLYLFQLSVLRCDMYAKLCICWPLR